MKRFCARAIAFWALGASLAGAALAVDGRLEADWLAHRQTAVSAVLPLTEDTPFIAESRYDASLMQSGAQLDLRFLPQEDPAWRVQQAFYDGNRGPYALTLGQKRLHWDYGYLSHPLNWFGPRGPDSDDAAEPLVSIQQFRGLSTDQLVCSLRLNDSPELCALRTHGFVDALDWQTAVAYERGWRVGTGASLVLGQRWAFHGALVWYESADRWRYRPGHVEQQTGPAWDALLGAHVSDVTGWQLWLEHHYDSRAFSVRDWRSLLSDLKALQGQPEALSLARAWQAPTLTAHRSLLRANQTLADRWELSASLIGFWSAEPAILADLEVVYEWNSMAELRAGWQSVPVSGILTHIGRGDAYRFGFNWILPL